MTLVAVTPAVILLLGALWTERRGGARVGFVAIGAAVDFPDFFFVQCRIQEYMAGSENTAHHFNRSGR